MDFSFLTSFFDQFFSFLQHIIDWVCAGFYDFFADLMAYVTKWLFYGWLKTQIFALDVAYRSAVSVYKDMADSLGIQSAYDKLPADVRAALNYFGIPKALSVILAAFGVRVGLRFVPFFGR